MTDKIEKKLKVALYARVSTTDKDQNPEVQLVQLREYCKRAELVIYQEYIDRASAVDYLGRTAWTQLMKDAAARRFDILLVFKFTRAFRSSIHAYNSLEILGKYKVEFRSSTEPDLDTNTMAGKIMFALLAAMAEAERDQIRENVGAGMDYARTHGTKSGLPIGRPRASVDFANVCNALVSAQGSYTAAAKILSEANKKIISPALVFIRIKRAAATMGIPMKELVSEIKAGNFTNPPAENALVANTRKG